MVPTHLLVGREIKYALSKLCKHVRFNSMFLALKVHRTPYASQWPIHGRGPGDPPTPLFLDQTYFFGRPGPSLMDDHPFRPLPPTHPYLKVWIRDCIF